MRLHIHHTTSYRYEDHVAHSTQYLRLTPRDSRRQKILSWQLRMPAGSAQSVDAYGNVLHVITVDFPHQDLRVEAEGIVEVSDDALDDGGDLSPMVFLRHTPLTEPDALLDAFARIDAALFTLDPQAAAWSLLERVHAHLQFQEGSTHAGTSAAQAFALAQGVCQDYTHVYLACARILGLPARYVSGYLFTERSEHVASHAWVEVWTGSGWWGLDVANRIEAGHQHLKLAVGMDYLDACPVRGVRVGGGLENLDATARVRIADEQQQQQQQQQQ